MAWKDVLRAELELNRGAPVNDAPVSTGDREERDSTQRLILRRAMCTAATVLQEAHAELIRAARRAMIDCDALRVGLSLDDRTLELKLLIGGLGLEVRREIGVIDVLQVEREQVVDGRRRLIPHLDGYFGNLVVELVVARPLRSTKN